MVAILQKEHKIQSQDEFDHGVRTYWNQTFEAARQFMEYELKECAKDAYDINAQKKGDMRLLCSIPARLAAWITFQEGTEDWKYDRDFIKCYQRYMNQTFLPEPSSEYGK